MKINGGGQPPVPGAAGAEGPLENQSVGGAEKATPSSGSSPLSVNRPPVGPTGKTFAETIAAPAAARAPEGTGPRPGEVAVRDLAADLEAGHIDARQAVDKLIERVVSIQLGSEASPQVRNQVTAALRDALESDPLLAAKLKSLG